MRTRGPAALALAGALLAACASYEGLPSEPPADFELVVEGRDATEPPCEFSLSLRADGAYRYSIRHRGLQPADRRGAAEADAAAVRTVWDAVLAAGFLALPEVIPGPGEGGSDGWAAYALTADGRLKSVYCPAGAYPGLDAVLQALLAAGPPRVLVPPGSE